MKKPSSTKHMFLVELVLPAGMTSTQMCYIIEGAIRSEPGAHHPEEPIFDLDRDTIKVRNAGKVLVGLRNATAALAEVKVRAKLERKTYAKENK